MDPVYNRFFHTADQAAKIKAAQEWLALNGHGVAIDGIYGPATRRAVRDFQTAHNLNVSGELDDETLNRLVDPMRTALHPIPAGGATLGEMVAAYGKQHLSVQPREVGGQNMGPWVRLYMYGNEGKEWPWCAGFVSFLLRQACESLNVELPFMTSPSCALMAESAMHRGMYLPEAEVAKHQCAELTGAVFFVRQPGRWVHTGIVIQATPKHFSTIEGNTNDEGSPEGYEVCQRIRGYENKDFILLG
jgi:hypothetical protein